MPNLIANFSVAQSDDGLSLVVTDLTNYVAAGEPYTGFTSRVVTMTLNDGTTFPVPAFPFVGGTNDTLVVPGIIRDNAFSVNMTLVKPVPVSGSIYTLTALYSLTYYLTAFLYSLLETIAARPRVLDDTLWQSSMRTLQNELVNIQIANQYNDQNAAQAAIDRAYYIMANSQNYF